MTLQQVEIAAHNPPRDECAEVKQPISYREVDESLSEWERARLTSKTWSMEQE